ncbi:butyryl-CoA:acetate CoA-transferase [Oscillibacter sp.]|uniref:butyryl-CoA:acetate CoA-transferase n=1 Tax=Oscillibacter sp. TaxID=1945593 RepID=UPI002897F569|nr:butyryl-CoA:acetate CoA-transferase [Oscillibacter sp.]
MSYQETYKQKLTTADEAVKVVKSGDWIDYGWCVGTADALDKALAKRADELTDVNIRGGVLTHRPAVMNIPDAAQHFTWNSTHMGGLERKMTKEGLAFYVPIRYSELPRYYRENMAPIDVLMIQVTPMDSHGWFNFGPSCSHLKAACERSKCIILEVNTSLPYCHGGFENGIHIDDVDMIVEGDNSLPDELGGAAQPSETDLAIARLVMEEIPNGACLQLGIGAMPGTVGKLIAESDLKDLGVHTEMYVDAFVDMSKAGKITGKYKPFDKGRQTFTFAAGTRKLYEFLDNNPQCMAAPVDYTNDVARVSQIPNFVSINGAVDIDLYGQVSSESSGTTHISGAGGQMDFVMGAYLSKGGKSFICCSSSVKDKKTGELSSRIRSTLLNGSVVTATRTNLHYLVTEYGKVNVKGMATWQRSEAIISIAHPQFREELIAEAEKMHIWRRSNKK